MPGGGFALCVLECSTGSEIVVCRGDDGRNRPWTPDTLVPIWSSTKGPAASALLWLLERTEIKLHSDLRCIWPEFPSALTLAQLLSHQAGLATVKEDLSAFDHQSVIQSLVTHPPDWPTGTAHGYHPRTWGFLLDEVSLRLTGERLGSVWNRELRAPLGLDLWMGLPEHAFPRMAYVSAARATVRPDETAFVAAFMQAGSLTRRAFDTPHGLTSISEFNVPAAWTCASPAMGGVASARGLAKFYQELAQGGPSPISENVIQHLATPLVRGQDRILQVPTVYSAGCQLDPVGENGRKLRQVFGPSQKAYGHPGAGGSVGFADPERGVGVGFVLNALSPGLFPSPAIQAVIHAALAT